MISGSRSVAVIGGGTVGLSTAYALWREGYDVTLIEEQAEVGRVASFSNGGQLSYRYVSPLAGPGVPLEALSWLGKAGSPISLNLKMDLNQWRWLFSFLSACTRSQSDRHASELLKLALASQKQLAQWREEGLDGFLWRRPGKLIIYRNIEKFRKASCALTDSRTQHVLGAEGCIAVEPAFSGLKSSLAGGIFTEDEEVADCHLYCQALLGKMQNSKTFRYMQATAALRPSANNTDQCEVLVNGRRIDTRHIVLAAGLASRAVAKPLGIDLPLYALRGYSLTLPAIEHATPSVSVTDYDNRVVYARLGDKLRIAAMVDIGLSSTRQQETRLSQLRTLAAQTLPAAGPYDTATPWIGARPATPSSVPIIGRTRWKNLLLNVGHGALGFTLSPGSARRVVELIQTEQ